MKLNDIIAEEVRKFEKEFTNVGCDERDLDGTLIKEEIKSFLTTAMRRVGENMKNETTLRHKIGCGEYKDCNCKGFNIAITESLNKVKKFLEE